MKIEQVMKERPVATGVTIASILGSMVVLVGRLKNMTPTFPVDDAIDGCFGNCVV